MEIVKLLERKGVIRFFGSALIISPFFNTFLTIMATPFGQDRFSWRIFWFITSNRSLVDQALYISTFTIGILMLRGAPWAWKCLMVLLGGYILNQTIHFGPNFKANKLSALFFLMNVGTFLFIADQLAWKIKKAIPKGQKNNSASAARTAAPQVTIPQVTVQPPVQVALEPLLQTAVPSVPQPAIQAASEPAPQPVSEPVQSTTSLLVSQPASPRLQLKSSKQHLIHFAGSEPWAKLLEISKDGIRVECISQPPTNIESAEVEISLGSKARFRIKYADSHDSIFHFKFQNLSKKDIQAVNTWLQQQAA